MLLTLCMVMSLFAGTTVTASAADGATTLYVNGVDTAGGSPAQYATAELKLNGYTAGAALNQATITTTSSTGFKSISLDGFMDKPDVNLTRLGILVEQRPITSYSKCRETQDTNFRKTMESR